MAHDADDPMESKPCLQGPSGREAAASTAGSTNLEHLRGKRQSRLQRRDALEKLRTILTPRPGAADTQSHGAPMQEVVLLAALYTEAFTAGRRGFIRVTRWVLATYRARTGLPIGERVAFGLLLGLYRSLVPRPRPPVTEQKHEGDAPCSA